MATTSCTWARRSLPTGWRGAAWGAELRSFCADNQNRRSADHWVRCILFPGLYCESGRKVAGSRVRSEDVGKTECILQDRISSEFMNCRVVLNPDWGTPRTHSGRGRRTGLTLVLGPEEAPDLPTTVGPARRRPSGRGCAHAVPRRRDDKAVGAAAAAPGCAVPRGVPAPPPRAAAR